VHQPDAYAALRVPAAADNTQTAGPITALRSQLSSTISPVYAWPDYSEATRTEKISVFPNHQSWYAETRERIQAKSWHPDLFRVICGDPRTAAREATWHRKGLLKGKTLHWHRGEYVRSLDPVVNGGEEVMPAGTEYRISGTRALKHSDDLGLLQWETPCGRSRSLRMAIQGVSLQVLQLEPLAGGDPVVTMADLPTHDLWRQQVWVLQQGLRSTRHEPAVHDAGLQLLDQLRHQAIRLRPASVIPVSLVGDRRFRSVALHSDVAEVEPELARQALRAAERELVILRR